MIIMTTQNLIFVQTSTRALMLATLVGASVMASQSHAQIHTNQVKPVSIKDPNAGPSCPQHILDNIRTRDRNGWFMESMLGFDVNESCSVKLVQKVSPEKLESYLAAHPAFQVDKAQPNFIQSCAKALNMSDEQTRYAIAEYYYTNAKLRTTAQAAQHAMAEIDRALGRSILTETFNSQRIPGLMSHAAELRKQCGDDGNGGNANGKETHFELMREKCHIEYGAMLAIAKEKKRLTPARGAMTPANKKKFEAVVQAEKALSQGQTCAYLKDPIFQKSLRDRKEIDPKTFAQNLTDALENTRKGLSNFIDKLDRVAQCVDSKCTTAQGKLLAEIPALPIHQLMPTREELEKSENRDLIEMQAYMQATDCRYEQRVNFKEGNQAAVDAAAMVVSLKAGLLFRGAQLAYRAGRAGVAGAKAAQAATAAKNLSVGRTLWAARILSLGADTAYGAHFGKEIFESCEKGLYADLESLPKQDRESEDKLCQSSDLNYVEARYHNCRTERVLASVGVAALLPINYAMFSKLGKDPIKVLTQKMGSETAARNLVATINQQMDDLARSQASAHRAGAIRNSLFEKRGIDRAIRVFETLEKVDDKILKSPRAAQLLTESMHHFDDIFAGKINPHKAAALINDFAKQGAKEADESVAGLNLLLKKVKEVQKMNPTKNVDELVDTAAVQLGMSSPDERRILRECFMQVHAR